MNRMKKRAHIPHIPFSLPSPCRQAEREASHAVRGESMPLSVLESFLLFVQSGTGWTLRPCLSLYTRSAY